MNETFSSLSSANPSASTFSVDVVSLAATATSSSQSSTATEAATSTSADTASTTPTSTGESDDSGASATGAIAGGVVGGVAGLAVIGAIVWLLLRRRSKKQAYEPPTSPLAAETEKHDQFGAASPGYSTPVPQYHIAEMEGTREINEMPGHGLRSTREIKELPSGQAEVRELPA